VSAVLVADVVAAELAEAGVRRVFGLPGGEVLYLMDALRRRGIEFALFRHEANAAIAAAVFGKLTRTAGVVLTTLGPGACNLLLPIANSYLDREPLIAISAQIPESKPASHTHQRLPLEQIFRPVTKYSARLTRENCREAIRAAVIASTSEPMGPAYLTLTADEAVVEGLPDVATPPITTTPPTIALMDPAAAAAQLVDQLTRSKHPLVLVGLGTTPSNSQALRQWLAEWQLPYGVTPKAKGLVDEHDPRFVGVVGGMAMDQVMRDAVQAADLVVGFGLDPVEIDQTWHDESPIAWILEAPLATGILPRRNLIAVRQSDLLQQLISQRPPRTWKDSFGDFRKKRSAPFNASARGAVEGIEPVKMIRELSRVLPPETIVVTDVGSHKYLFGQFWPSSHPETFFVSNGLSAMGYGLPAAIGAKLARPQSPVLLAIGDGGFSMNSQELETAKRLGVALLVVVLADQSYSLIRLAQESHGWPNFGVDFGPIDSVATALACGIPALRVETVEQLVSELAGANKSGASLVAEVPLAVNSYKGIV
jgi:acetolactate synthase-1/2/3 large subunit